MCLWYEHALHNSGDRSEIHTQLARLICTIFFISELMRVVLTNSTGGLPKQQSPAVCLALSFFLFWWDRCVSVRTAAAVPLVVACEENAVEYLESVTLTADAMLTTCNRCHVTWCSFNSAREYMSAFRWDHAFIEGCRPLWKPHFSLYP